MSRRDRDRERDYPPAREGVEYVRDYRTESPPPPRRGTVGPEDAYYSPDPRYPPDPYHGAGGYYSTTSPRHSQPAFSPPPAAAPPPPASVAASGANYHSPSPGDYRRPPSPGGYHRPVSPPTYGQRARSRPASPPTYGQRARSRPASPPSSSFARARSRAASRTRVASRPASPSNAGYGRRSPSPDMPKGVRFVEPAGADEDERGRPSGPTARDAPSPMTAAERDAWDRVYQREAAEARELAREKASGPHDRGFSVDMKTSGGTEASIAYSGSRAHAERRHRDEVGLAWSDSDSDSGRETPPRRPRRYDPSPRRHDSVAEARRTEPPPPASVSHGIVARVEPPLPPPPPPPASIPPSSIHDPIDDHPRRPPQPTVRYQYEEPRRYVTENVVVSHINRPPSPDRRPAHYPDDPYYDYERERERERDRDYDRRYYHEEIVPPPHHAYPDDPYYGNPRSSAGPLRHASIAGVSAGIERIDFHDRRGSVPPVAHAPYPPSPPMGAYRGSRFEEYSPLPSPEMLPRDRVAYASRRYDVDEDFALDRAERVDRAERYDRPERSERALALTGPGAWPAEVASSSTAVALEKIAKVDKPQNVAEPHYDPTEHAQTLYKALKGKSADSLSIIKILPFLSGFEVVALRHEYKKVHPDKMSLSKHIKASFSGKFQLAAYVAASGPWESECYWAKLSGQKPQFRYDLLVEAIMGRTNDEILDIRDAYTDKKNDHNIITALEKELSADKNTGARFTEMIMLQLKAKRMEEWDNVYVEKIKEDVKHLHETILKDKADVSFLIEFVVLRNDTHLRETMKLYKKTHNNDLARAIFSKVPTLVGDALLHVLNGVLNRPARDARLLEESMKGVGTRDELLVARLTRLHWDPEHMKAVKEAYKEKYKRTLKDRIVGDTSGEYQAFLVAMTTVGTPGTVVVKK